MDTFRLLIHAVRDLLRRKWLPAAETDPPGYAFIVHPRNYPDVRRKYPFFKYIPEKMGKFFLRHFWPVVLCDVRGISTLRSPRKKLRGWIITIPLTAEDMREQRHLAVAMIRKSIVLAAKMGVKMVGLGALTASFTKRGEALRDILDEYGMGITTGAGYTTYNVVEIAEALAEKTNIHKETALVAIVGAAGSIGSTSARYLAHRGWKNFLLIDMERKNKNLRNLEKELLRTVPAVFVRHQHQLTSLHDADLIITATNAPEALVWEDDIKPGAVIVDDAQPSDIHPDVIKNREDIIVVVGGAAHLSHVRIPFNFGLRHREDVFSCLAETMILAAEESWQERVFGNVSLSYIERMAASGKKLNFTTAHFQNFYANISKKRIANIQSIHKHQCSN